MKPLFATLLAFGIYLTPPTVILTPHTVLAQTQDENLLEQMINLLQKAIQYTQQEKPQQAIETSQQLLDIMKKIEGKDVEEIKAIKTIKASVYLLLGTNYSLIEQHQEALAQYNHALLFFREINDTNREAITLNLIEITQDSIGSSKKALNFLIRSALYDSIGQPKEALNFLNQALSISREEGDRKIEANILNSIGRVYLRVGNREDSLKYFNQALSIIREVGNRNAEVVSLNSIGLIYLDMGKLEEALKYFNQALYISREVGNRNAEASTLTNIGSVHSDMGKPEGALKYFKQALPILQVVGNRKVEAITLNNIGLVYDNIGKPEEALKYFNQALPIRREVGDRSGEATTLNNIGTVYHNIGKPEEALKYYNQALPITREVGDRGGEATTLNNIGAVYNNIGKPEEALKYFNQAVPITREVGDRNGEATTLNNIGEVYRSIGKPEDALKYVNQALPITREVGNRRMEATTLNNIGAVYNNIGKPEDALKYVNQALPITREVGDRRGEAGILSNIGLVYRDTNRPTEAIDKLEESVKITLELRRDLSRENRQAFLQKERGTAVALIDLLIKQNQPEKAFVWANLVTTYDLADYTRLIKAKVANPEAQQEIDQWNELNESLTSLLSQQEENQRQGKYSTELSRRINEIQAQANQKAEDIARRFPEVAELFETQPADINQLQQNLPQNTVVIQPVLLTGIKNLPNTIALFVITHDKLTVIQKPLPDNFEQLVTDLRQQLETISTYRETSAQLYDILIRPVEANIPAGHQVAIIATGNLRNIPFEALYDQQAEQFLLEKYPVSYLTRLSKYQNAVSSNKKQSLTVLAITNPKPTQQELTGTEAEADYIMQNFPGSQDFRQEQATINQFKDKALGFSILHLGTHGCFVPQGCPTLGMDSNTLLFANKQQYPIADAALLGLTKTELLVLSACQTAKITDVEGVGLSGLAYVWERAGAKSIIASLWNAPDMESTEIMTQFYNNLKQGMSKAEAMRQAKISLIKNNKHPYFWSPFILIGDAQ